MLYEYTIRGCVCHLSMETIEAIEENLRAIEEERARWEDMRAARKKAEKTNDPIDWAIFSDLYKDCYGVRPRY